VLAGIACAAAAQAATPDTVFLEELTWTEVRDALKAGKTTIILPTGGTEQNGPHMAIGKHNYIVRHTAERIARSLGNALVAPVMAYAPEGGIHPPTEHMAFPGTITLPDEHFRKVVEWAARSFRVNGFKDIVFIGDSGPKPERDEGGRRAPQQGVGGERRAHPLQRRLLRRGQRRGGRVFQMAAVARRDAGGDRPARGDSGTRHN
jgi:hypothetical protein